VPRSTFVACSAGFVSDDVDFDSPLQATSTQHA
jgi:hypothetical protein